MKGGPNLLPNWLAVGKAVGKQLCDPLSIDLRAGRKIGIHFDMQASLERTLGPTLNSIEAGQLFLMYFHNHGIRGPLTELAQHNPCGDAMNSTLGF